MMYVCTKGKIQIRHLLSIKKTNAPPRLDFPADRVDAFSRRRSGFFLPFFCLFCFFVSNLV